LTTRKAEAVTISYSPIQASPVAREDRVIDVFLRYLKAEGVSFVFGIPGGLLYPFFAAVERDHEIELVMARHEEGAAFMADGYARVSRKLAICAGTAGPGATNMMTGVACAFADGVPMLVLTGQAASHALGKGAAQETSREDVDIVAMFRPITKYSAMVTSAESMAHHLRRALRHALTGRPGPVHLNVPVDIWERPLTEVWFDPKTYRPEVHTFERAAVQSAASALLAAKRPVLFAGAGVGISGAMQHLRALAELLPARVATTPRGKGLFPEDHALSLGVMGFAGHASARDTILSKEVDLLFTIGTSLNETATLNWAPGLRLNRTFIQLDIDYDRIGRSYPVDMALVGDAQTVLVELVYHMHRLMREGSRPASTWAEQPRERRVFSHPELRDSEQVPLSPQRWRRDLEEVTPANAIVFSDIGGHMLSNIHYLTIREHQTFVLNLGFGSMGHGTVAPIGAALAAPGRPVIAIIGDACFTMNGMELITAVECRLAKLVWIVENNNMHGITFHAARMLSSGALDSVRYKRPLEVAAIARAMGMAAWVVDSPNQIQEILLEALSVRGPALIEVRVDPNIPPPLSDRVQSIAGFVEK
jgi:acetolactate synthase-1/2/3 large subunit